MTNKEDAYAQKWDAGTVAADLYKYIPRRIAEAGAIDNAFADSDGYWIWLNHEEGGWVAYDGGEDCGTIHEYTIEDLKKAIKTIRKVTA